jgi:aminoglycoside phosphotransferase (APT) family kinase protein
MTGGDGTSFIPDAQVTMHRGEVYIDASIVRRLLAAQLPHLSEKPITVVRSTGTVNAVFRLGDDLCVRLPRMERWVGSLLRELTWLPRLAPCLSLSVPKPVAQGSPADCYPYHWAVYEWLDGSTYEDHLVIKERKAADDLAAFVIELRQISQDGAPRGGRAPLIELDRTTRQAIEGGSREVDTRAVLSAWTRSLETKPWDGVPVWIHADLLRSNLLIKAGELTAVLDFGGIGVGDPAFDVIPAWSVFSKVGRDAFRSALDVDDDTWARARGYALHQALLIIPYYVQSNPMFVLLAKRTVNEVLSDIR